VGQTEISWHCNGLMCKNREKYVVDFACAKSHRVIILHKLTDMHQKLLASFGLHVDRVPVACQRLHVHGILPVLTHCGQHRSLSSWVNDMGCALHTLCVLCKEQVYCPILAISSTSSSITCMGPLTWVHADVEVVLG
jgi:hypothetical protein